jgi:hypothetical protein
MRAPLKSKRIFLVRISFNFILNLIYLSFSSFFTEKVAVNRINISSVYISIIPKPSMPAWSIINRYRLKNDVVISKKSRWWF